MPPLGSDERISNAISHRARNTSQAHQRRSNNSGRGGTPRTSQPGPPPPPSDPAAQLRKFRAKRFNEQIKAAYGFLNTLAGAVLLTAWIGPGIRGEPMPMGLDNPVLVIGGFGLHIVGQFLVWKFTRPEE